MKTVIVFLLCATSLLAQVPTPKGDVTPQSVPVLQEWWRADNMGYGINGMTWLDNFYNGKGALVISTPNGVQTWQLRYPWDTINVFTWSGGDANIKTGDFNGDGVTDYVDGKRNIYIGTKNGELPNKNPIQPTFSLSPWIIYDFNGDTYDDIWGGYSFLLGGNNLGNLKKVDINRSKEIDTNTVPLAWYHLPNNEMRVLCQYTHGKFNTKTSKWVYDFDGYKLFKMTWDNNLDQPVFELLSQVNREKEGLFWTGTILNQSIQYFISAEYLTGSSNGNPSLTNLVIYNLSNDTFEKVSETRMDGIVEINQLKLNPVTNDSNAVLIKYRGSFPIRAYKVFNSINEIPQFSLSWSYYGSQVLSLPDRNNDNKHDLCFVNNFFNGNDDENHFLIQYVKDSTTSVDDAEQTKSFFIKVVPHPTSSSKKIELQLNQQITSPFSISIHGLLGLKILIPTENIVMVGNQNVIVDITNFHFTAGQYSITLNFMHESFTTSFILE